MEGRKKGGERREKEKGVREGGERRGKKKGKEKGEKEEKEREGGTDPLSHSFRNKFLCKNIYALIEREKRINKSFTG